VLLEIEEAAPVCNCESILLWSKQKNDLSYGAGRLEFYRSSSPRAPRNPTVLIIPGGGYRIVAPKEGAPVAARLLNEGYHAAVLYYRTNQGHPAPFADVARAMRLLRFSHEKFGIDPERIGMLGFSAGAHLAGLATFAPDLYTDIDDDLAADQAVRPDRLIMVYPVARLSPPTHEQTAAHFFGQGNVAPLNDSRFDLVSRIDSNAPPFLLVHARDDDVAPFEASAQVIERARALQIDAEFLPLECGGHGFVLDSLASEHWPSVLLEFLAKL
jgi:acetyl esterase/lipase